MSLMAVLMLEIRSFFITRLDFRLVLRDTNKVEQLDLLLTTTSFKFAEKVYGGATKKSILRLQMVHSS